MIETKFYRLPDLQKELGIGVRTLREYIKKKELKAKKIGRTYYVTESAFKSFMGDSR